MSFGVGGCLYRWIRDFLFQRSIKVVINGCESSSGLLNAGVPQGSILGPTLFLIFINDLSEVVSSQVHMFADDTTISAVVPTIRQRAAVSDTLSSDLTEVDNWAKNWLVAFNVKKTQLLGISRKKVKDNCVVRFMDEVLKF